jgi:hypothetical protein
LHGVTRTKLIGEEITALGDRLELREGCPPETLSGFHLSSPNCKDSSCSFIALFLGQVSQISFSSFATDWLCICDITRPRRDGYWFDDSWSCGSSGGVAAIRDYRDC